MADRWFKIVGQAKGDRTIEEQMQGLQPALAESKGRAVLDLGCAEGLIGREFVMAGCASVRGIEYLERHLEVARRICAGLPITFQSGDLDHLAPHEMATELPARYHTVLALAVIHKLRDPGRGLRFCCWSSSSLVVLRLPDNGATRRGLIRSKHNAGHACHIAETMNGNGFKLIQTLPGPRQEPVQYWRRIPANTSPA